MIALKPCIKVIGRQKWAYLLFDMSRISKLDSLLEVKIFISETTLGYQPLSCLAPYALFWDYVEFKTRFKHGLKFYNCTCANTKNMFCSNNFNFSQHLFLFLHDLIARIYTNVYHMFTYEQSWSYQTKRSA